MNLRVQARLFDGAGAIGFDTGFARAVRRPLDKEGEPQRIRVSAPSLHEEATKELAAPGVLDDFVDLVRRKQSELKGQVESDKQKVERAGRSKGCALALPVLLGGLIVVCALASLLT